MPDLVVFPYPPTTCKHIRKVSNWSVNPMKDEKGSWLSLSGFVVEGTLNERPLAEGCSIRATQTSPIRSAIGRVLLTDSGSEYTLIGPPLPGYLSLLEKYGLKYSDEVPVPLELLVEYVYPSEMEET